MVCAHSAFYVLSSLIFFLFLKHITLIPAPGPLPSVECFSPDYALPLTILFQWLSPHHIALSWCLLLKESFTGHSKEALPLLYPYCNTCFYITLSCLLSLKALSFSGIITLFVYCLCSKQNVRATREWISFGWFTAMLPASKTVPGTE